MNRDDILRMALEAGFWGAEETALPPATFDEQITIEEYSVGAKVERFATLVAAAEREAAISKIENETCHAEINNLRLAPLFGQRHGPLAVRVDSLEAVIDAIRARGKA